MSTQLPVPSAQLDPPRLRLRPRSPPLGPNMVGNFWLWSVPPLGRGIYIRRTRIPEPLALAWRFGCITGRWVRYDSSSDADAHAHLLRITGLASPGLHRYYLRESLRSESCRPGADLPGYHGGFERDCECLVLDCPALPVADMCRILALLPQRTTFETIVNRGVDALAYLRQSA